MKPNIICIAGPTASGKTALAVRLAKELGACVISCDSMQVYRRMDIGTAKPTREEMDGVHHYMLDVAEPWENFSVSRYCAMAEPILQELLASGKTVIVAGGTGLYMDALMRGGDFAPSPRSGFREELEAQADALGMEVMLKRLGEIDPESAARLHLADRKRILRALEVYYETGSTITEHNRRTAALPPKYTPLWLGLNDENRQTLYNRIDRRVGVMLEMGLLDEIRALLAEGIPPEATALQAIGYKEFVAALEGKCTVEEAADQVRQSSRRYAKRQLTWFRRNPAMHWLIRGEGQAAEEILQTARKIAMDFDT